MNLAKGKAIAKGKNRESIRYGTAELQVKILWHLICLFTLIINVYGLEVRISTIKTFTSGRGWGMTSGT